MGGAHQDFEGLGRQGVAFEFEQGGGDGGSLVFRLVLEKLQHREIAQIFWILFVHERLRFRGEKSSSSSRWPTARSCHARTPRVKLESARATVAGASFKSSA